MRKIKGLKIPIRYYDIERKIKKKGLDLKSIFGGEDTSTDLKNFLSSIASKIDVLLVYDNFKISDVEFLKQTVSDRKANYASCGFITFGSDLEEKIKSFDKNESQIVDIFVEVHFRTSLEIINDIVEEEAKKERLKCGDVILLYDPLSADVKSDFQSAYSLINPEMIGIKLYENKLFPFFSWIFVIPWISSKK